MLKTIILFFLEQSEKTCYNIKIRMFSAYSKHLRYQRSREVVFLNDDCIKYLLNIFLGGIRDEYNARVRLLRTH